MNKIVNFHFVLLNIQSLEKTACNTYVTSLSFT
nr:MAG TPA: hypothetical protein [Caudoviricetes sp.]